MADQKTQLDVILNVKGVKELRGLTNSLQGLKNTKYKRIITATK